MPNRDENTEQKRWYKTWWKAFIGALGIIGVLYGVLEGVYFFTEQYYDYKIIKEKVDHLDEGDLDFEKRISEIERYIGSKRKSFAVGFRVFKEVDEETSHVTYRKRYRDWSGQWHEIFLDHEYSSLYGMDYYYYINKETGEKIYCW